MKKILIIFMCIVLALSFVGCRNSREDTADESVDEIIIDKNDSMVESNTPSIDTQTVINQYQLNFDVSKVDAYLMFLGDSLVYMQYNYYGGVNYYRYYFENEETVNLGAIPNFCLSTKNTVLIDNVIYFYIAEFQDDNMVKNVLYGIDIDDNTLERYEFVDESVIGIYAYEFDGNVATIKNEVNEDIILTYMEVFNTSTKTFANYFINTFDSVNYEGSAIHGLYGNDDKVYIFTDEYAGGFGTSTTVLKEYDLNMEETRTITVDKEIFDSIFNNRIKDMAVFGEYIYIINMSNKAVFGKIVNDNIEPLLFESDLELAMHQDGNSDILLFKRNSNKCFSVNCDSGEISAIELNIRSGIELGEDNAISWLMVGEDNVMLICHDKEKPSNKYMYYLDKSLLEYSYFSCGK